MSKTAPRYDAVRRECERILLQGGAQPGDRVFGFRELMRQHSVGQATLERALRPLLEEKILEAREKSGLFVTPEIERWRQRHADSKVKRLGVILPFWANDATFSMPAAVVSGLCQGAGCDWRIELIPNDLHESYKPEFVQRILGHGLHAAVWLHPQARHVPNMVRLQERGLPLVTVARSFDAVEAPCVRIDAAALAQSVMQWLPQDGSQFAVVGGAYKDHYYGEMYDGLRAVAGERLKLEHIGQLFDIPDQAQHTAAFFKAHVGVKHWVFLTPNNFAHVLPSATVQARPPETGHQFLYLDMGADAVRGFWPYPYVHRLVIDFVAMGKEARKSAGELIAGVPLVAPTPAPVHLEPCIVAGPAQNAGE